jgi:hypothetical protein
MVLERVCEGGYEWRNGVDGSERLVPRRAAGSGYRRVELYPALFREFADLPPTKDAILEFAGRFGDLFNRYTFNQSVELDDGTVALGSSYGTWTKEIGDMLALVGLWDHLRRRQIAPLKKVIVWTEKDLSYVIQTPKRSVNETLAHADLPESGYARFSRRNILLPAKCALQREINRRLVELATTPCLMWTPDFDQRLVFTPPNLMGALWLQFAQAVIGQFDLYPCRMCHKFFQRGPGGRRADAITCSDACRQRKSRNDKAKRLKPRGKKRA